MTLTYFLTAFIISLECCVFGLFLYQTLTPRFSPGKTLLLACVILTAGASISSIDYANIPYHQLVNYAAIIFSCRALYTDPWKRILFSLAHMIFIAFGCDFVITIIFGQILPTEEGIHRIAYVFLANLLFVVLFSACGYLFLLFWRRKRTVLLPKSIYATVLFPASQWFLIEAVNFYVMLQFAKGVYQPHVLVLVAVGSGLSIFADMILFQVMADNSQKERLAAQIEMMNEQARRELAYYSSINEKIQEIRKIRHDFNNQLQTAYGVILRDQESGQKQAEQLLNQLEKQIQEQEQVYYCANLIVNVILEEKARIAEEQQIVMDISVELPEQIAIEKSDLCSMFSNLLDHAVYEARRTDRPGPVTVRARIEAGDCMIQVTNPVSRRREHDREDSLGGLEWFVLHGIAEKYGGEFRVSEERGIFTADMKLKTE